MARRGDLNSSYVSHVLSGKTEPGPKFYQGIAKAFDYPIETIERLDRDGTIPHEPTPDEELTFRELLTIVRKLSPGQRREVLEYALYRLRRQQRETSTSGQSREATSNATATE